MITDQLMPGMAGTELLEEGSKRSTSTARIILTALVTPAEAQDNQPALDLLWRRRSTARRC